jgi:hypothetical protein
MVQRRSDAEPDDDDPDDYWVADDEDYAEADDPEDDDGESLAEEYDAYVARFRNRSSKGNLWQIILGATVTIFTRADGRYGWCVARGGGRVLFSPAGFATQEQAMNDLWDFVMSLPEVAE